MIKRPVKMALTPFLLGEFILSVLMNSDQTMIMISQGLASRVPYESAARTLTQTKRSYAGYMVRQG
jgi:hypothetical protein